MNRLQQLKIYPFGLLLWLEWILLGAVFSLDLPYLYWTIENNNPNTDTWFGFILSFVCMVALGIMGLKFPEEKLHRWLYFALEIALIGLQNIYNHTAELSIFSYLIVAMRNGLLFKPKECKLANLLLFVSFLPSIFFIESYPEYQAYIARQQEIAYQDYQLIAATRIVSATVMSALCIILFWVLVNALLQEHQSQQQLAQARAKLRRYALQAEDRATIQERNRIAREIHDSVGHALTAQKIQLHNAIVFWQSEPTKAYQFLLESRELVATALKDIRHSVSTLRSDPLRGKNLDTEIALLCQNFSHRTKVKPNLTAILDYPLTEEIKLTVYRIVQEALTNIAKHSEPTRVNLKVQTFSEYLYLSIADNGRGFNLSQNTTGFGLQGIRERVVALDGSIDISSSLGSGCTITVSIPL